LGEGGGQGAAKARLGLSVGAGEGRIWGMTGAERLARQFHRLGLETPVLEDLQGLPASTGVVIARADWVYDARLIAALVAQPGVLLVGPEGAALAAHVAGPQTGAAAQILEGRGGGSTPGLDLVRLDPAALAYDEVLRKREAPVLEPLTAANVRQVEARLFQGSYKGVTDIVTKHLWPVPARIVTRWCAMAGVTPNQVTFAGFLLVIAAFALFWTGQFGWGLVCAWIMTFLDTVDGKLARVTLTSSKLGNIFDHGIDLVHPPFWWWAWLVGLQHTRLALPHPALILTVVVGGYVAQRMAEGVFLKRYGIHMHAWRPFDSWFRLITARRNPNLLLLTATSLLGRPDVGLAAVALWTALSLLVHLAQIAQAAALPRARVTSWLAR